MPIPAMQIPVKIHTQLSTDNQQKVIAFLTLIVPFPNEFSRRRSDPQHDGKLGRSDGHPEQRTN